ncbi:MAG: ribonuclease D [Pseudomonadales bacterium]
MSEIQIQEHELVQSSAQLANLISTWRDLDFVCIDTEFMRSDTYFAELALVQISAGQDTVLVDPLVDGMDDVLRPLLCDFDLIKVLHAGSEDLQILAQYCGAPLNSIYDTQIAAALAGYGFSLAYGKLVAQLCEVELDKGQTRSDWTQRPLTDKQLQYAAADVLYLPAIYKHLANKLELLGRAEWMHAECSELVSIASMTVEPEAAFNRVGRAWQLKDRSLLCLQRLAAWREHTAISSNRPRNWILKDKSLWQMAERLPKGESELASIDEMSPGQIRRYGTEVLGIVSECADASVDDYPASLAEPAGKSYSQVSKKLRAAVQSTAKELDLAPEMLARKKDIEFILASHANNGVVELPASLKGWRYPVIGETLIEQFTAHYSNNNSVA